MTIREADAEIVIDGTRWTLEPQIYTVGGEHTVRPFREFVIPPGETEELVVFSYGFMPREGFNEFDLIEISLPVGEERLLLTFEDVRSVEAVMR